jgi:hypothetical protein
MTYVSWFESPLFLHDSIVTTSWVHNPEIRIQPYHGCRMHSGCSLAIDHRDHLIDSILVLVFSKKFRNFKRIAESLDIFHEDLIRRKILIDVIFGSELAYQEKERDHNEDHLQDFSHGFLHPRELAGYPYAGRIIREAWVKI